MVGTKDWALRPRVGQWKPKYRLFCPVVVCCSDEILWKQLSSFVEGHGRDAISCM